MPVMPSQYLVHGCFQVIVRQPPRHTVQKAKRLAAALFQQFGYSLFVRSYHRRFTRLLQRVGHRRRLHNCFADSLSILAKHPVDRPDAQLVYKIGSSYSNVIFHHSHLLKNLTTFLSPTFSTKWPL